MNMLTLATLPINFIKILRRLERKTMALEEKGWENKVIEYRKGNKTKGRDYRRALCYTKNIFFLNSKLHFSTSIKLSYVIDTKEPEPCPKYNII